MARWKYRKRVRLLPGVTINISKSGLSTTLGPRGANINLGRSGAFLNTGIPGTGIYNRQKIGQSRNKPQSHTDNNPYEYSWKSPYSLKEVQQIFDAYEFEKLGSERTRDLEKALQIMAEERLSLLSEEQEILQALDDLKLQIQKSKQLLYGYLFRGKEEEFRVLEENLEDTKARIAESIIKLKTSEDLDVSRQWDIITHAFQRLRTSAFIWDITSVRAIDYMQLKSAAKKEYQRVKTTLNFNSLEIIESEIRALHFVNAKGMDIYLYPTLAIIQSEGGRYVVYDYNDLKIHFRIVEFVEEQYHPTDAELIRETWLKININGEPDRRFKANRKVPVYAYGALAFRCENGLEEEYLFSNFKLAESFYTAWNEAFSDLQDSQ